jgi:Protein of unknown function DUF262
MDVQHPVYAVADYVAMLDRGEVTVNRDYQRSAKVWPTAARSFLIETIMLGYAVPKLALHQKTDPTTLRPLKQVVDGQQRTNTVREFLAGGFRLSTRLDTAELRGKRFDQLDDEYKRTFLNYGLSFDLFIDATDGEVREVFRRINSFTAPLNPEEQRHARYQGNFKWFIRRLTTEYDPAFRVAGVFSDRALIRMADAKLLTEMSHAFFHGIETTNKNKLEKLYRDKDSDFPEEADLGARLRTALNEVFGREELRGGPLFTKVHVFYSFVLATMHILQPVEALADDVPVSGPRSDSGTTRDSLAALAAALDDDDLAGPFSEFVAASAERTNVADQRIARVRWLVRALTEPLAE